MALRSNANWNLPQVNTAFDPAIASMIKALDTDVELSGEYTVESAIAFNGTTITIPIAGAVPGVPYAWEWGIISNRATWTGPLRESIEPSHVIVNATGQLVATWGAWDVMAGSDFTGDNGRIFVRNRRFKRK